MVQTNERLVPVLQFQNLQDAWDDYMLCRSPNLLFDWLNPISTMRMRRKVVTLFSQLVKLPFLLVFTATAVYFSGFPFWIAEKEMTFKGNSNPVWVYDALTWSVIRNVCSEHNEMYSSSAKRVIEWGEWSALSGGECKSSVVRHKCPVINLLFYLMVSFDHHHRYSRDNWLHVP